MKYTKSFCLSVTILLTLVTYCQKQLFFPTSDTGFIVPQKDTFLIPAKAIIRFDHIALRSAQNQKLKITLPVYGNTAGLTVNIIKNKQTINPTNNSFSWYGSIENQPESFVLFSIVNNAVAGHIRTRSNKIYQIISLGNNIHQIGEINQRYFGPDDTDASGVADMSDEDNLSCCDTTGKIDVMVVYTSNAKNGAGGRDGILSQIIQSVNITNESYARSNIRYSIDLVHSAEIDYEESENPETDRNRLRDTSDNFMDEVHKWRNDFSADIVLLIVESMAGATGIAYIMERRSAGFESYAFGVIKREASFSNLTFPHELGHIMGARHECRDDRNSTPASLNHGYSTPSLRTIMSKNLSVTRVEFWSNPDIFFPTTREPAGILTGNCPANNAQILNDNFFTISQFRCKIPCPETTLQNEDSLLKAGENGDHDNGKKNNSLLERSWLFWLITGCIITACLIIYILRKRKRRGTSKII